MPTSLETVHKKLCSRLRILDAVFDRFLAIRLGHRRFDRSAFQEGLVSALWQTWCGFCRSTLIDSAQGTTTGSGNPVTSPYAGRPEMEIAYIAKELAERRPIRKIKTLAGSHQEPTWGDVDKALRIAAGMNSTNQSQLLGALGSALSLSDLQLCRNASAHLNSDLLTKVNAAKVRYDQAEFIHPSDFIYWVDPITRNFVWKTWVDDMKAVSRHATA